MNKGLLNAMKAARAQGYDEGYLDGTSAGVKFASMTTLIALHNIVGDGITDTQYAELEVEMQRILDEHVVNTKEDIDEATELFIGITNQIRVAHGMPFIPEKDWEVGDGKIQPVTG